MRWIVASASVVLLALVGVMPSSVAYQCASSANCTFWDDNYHEYMLSSWDTANLDVIVVPPASAFAVSELSAMLRSINEWENAIQAMSPTWLRSNLQINTYVVGIDNIPKPVLKDPEIVVVAAEAVPFLTFGIGLHQPVTICGGPVASEALLSQHRHEGSPWETTMARCDNGGLRCFVIDTNPFLYGYERSMYDLNAHEFGHCLGVGHVGDAGDFGTKLVPTRDVMSYQYDPNQVNCVSNLNMKGIAGAFAQVMGRPSSEWLDSGDFITMAPGSYSQRSCSNPPVLPLLGNKLVFGVDLPLPDAGEGKGVLLNDAKATVAAQLEGVAEFGSRLPVF